jgi:tRNA pseudouridine38-40 synthase
MEMKRIELIVSYDGTNYCGWQIQKNGITVEEILNRELSKLLKEEIAVIGASRTDSGVHCRGNIAVFDTETRIPPEKISYALNERLPQDIVIQQSREVVADFHPRKCNSRKTYEYRIWNHRFRDPLCRLYSYFVYVPLDVEAMKTAAAYLVGEHDFASFCSSGSQATTTVRTLYEVAVEKEGNMITVRLTGNGFLYNMVRIIVGTLLKIGMHVYPAEHMKEILDARDRNAAGPKVPGVGLTLMKIEIEPEEPHYLQDEN